MLMDQDARRHRGLADEHGQLNFGLHNQLCEVPMNGRGGSLWGQVLRLGQVGGVAEYETTKANTAITVEYILVYC